MHFSSDRSQQMISQNILMSSFVTVVLLTFGSVNADDAVVVNSTQQSSPRTSGLQAPFRQSSQAFIDAYSSTDAEAIGRLFTENAVYFDEFGRRITGRAAIIEMARMAFISNPDLTVHAIHLENVRHPTANVAIEEGLVISSDTSNGPRFPSRYIATHIKDKDANWKINTFTEFPREESERQRQLSRLAWLVGDWVYEEPDARVRSVCEWSGDGNYLIERFTVATREGAQLTGEQRITWDAANKQLRSWTFDSEGGVFQRTWERKGNRWVAFTTGVTGDGESASATVIYQKPDRNTIIFEYIDLIIADVHQSSIRPVTMVRTPPTAAVGKEE